MSMTLLDLTERLARMESFYDNTTSFKSFINEQGFSTEELE